MHTGWPSTVNDTGDSSKASAPGETTHASMKMNKLTKANYENECIKINKQIMKMNTNNTSYENEYRKQQVRK